MKIESIAGDTIRLVRRREVNWGEKVTLRRYDD